MDETIEYKGYTIKIATDQFADDPRHEDYGNLGTMICFHDRYKLGDAHTYADFDKFTKEHGMNKTFMLPLYLYDHSGLTISTKPFGDRWDSGQVGVIYCDIEKAKKEFPNYKDFKKLKAHVYKILENEVKTYDQYLRGEVYTSYVYEAKKCDKCGHSELEEIDGQGNIYGYDEALGLAKSCIDNLVGDNKQLIA